MIAEFLPVARRVVSAALPFAPGDEFAVPGGRLRVVAVSGHGWAAVPVGGRARPLSLTLRTTPGGTVLTVAGPSGTADGLVAWVRARALALADAAVVVGAAIVRGGELLAQQRAYPAEAAGLWELPGGRVEPGESDAAAVARECREELGVDVTVGPPVGPDVALPGGKLLRVHLAALVDPAATPHPHDHADLRWLKAGQLGSVPWLPADRVLLPALRQVLRHPAGSSADASADAGQPQHRR